MPVQPSDFLKISKDLVGNKDEISHRGAASRAYYCAYHKTCKTIAGPMPKYNCGSHEALTIYLTSKDADSSETIDQQTRKRLSIMLTNMKTQRHIADYQLDIAFTKNQAESVIGMTERLISMLDPH